MMSAFRLPESVGIVVGKCEAPAEPRDVYREGMGRRVARPPEKDLDVPFNGLNNCFSYLKL